MRDLLIALALLLGVIATWPLVLFVGFGLFVIGTVCALVFGETRHGR